MINNLPKQVVLIENDDDFRFVMTTMLKEMNYPVTSFSHVKDIEEVISSPAGLFIIDEHLPVINGHTLCMILKSKPATKTVPVILISGSAELEQLALLCNADLFLGKPFTQEDLQKATLQVLKND